MLSSGRTTQAVAASASVVAPGISADDLPLQWVYRWEKERGQVVFLTQPVLGRARDWTWAQTMDEARRMATWLGAQGWPNGSRVAILSKNCAWWVMAELAIWMAGHVTVPIYASLSAESVRTQLEHCEPVCCFVGALDDNRVLTEGIPPNLERIAFPTAQDSRARSWESIVAFSAPLTGSPVRDANELATIIYTSGTTGAPKGVMHRFASFAYFVKAQTRVIGEPVNERFISYLPLAHVAERALVEAIALWSGQRLFFIEKIDTFVDDIRRGKPTIFFSVPRLYIKFLQRVFERIPERRLNLLLKTPLIGRMIGRRILKEMGLDCARIATSGGAPLPLEVLAWYRRLGLHLVEGYGMTETGITHTPNGGRSKPGYVGDGPPFGETKISDDGEVLIKSPMNMLGYYKDPESTSKAFTDDGFFRTGDLGELDTDGWLKITGRIKEQFKTSRGKYVAPSHIEELISVHQGVEACCVMGRGLADPFAMVLVSKDERERRGEFEHSLKSLLLTVNARLEAHERLAFFVVTDEPWTIANGVLTPTMKLKRSALESRYSEYFDTWVKAKSPVVWHMSSRAEKG